MKMSGAVKKSQMECVFFMVRNALNFRLVFPFSPFSPSSFSMQVNNFTIFVYAHSLTLLCTQYMMNELWEIFPPIFFTTHALTLCFHSIFPDLREARFNRLKTDQINSLLSTSLSCKRFGQLKDGRKRAFTPLSRSDEK